MDTHTYLTTLQWSMKAGSIEDATRAVEKVRACAEDAGLIFHGGDTKLAHDSNPQEWVRYGSEGIYRNERAELGDFSSTGERALH